MRRRVTIGLLITLTLLVTGAGAGAGTAQASDAAPGNDLALPLVPVQRLTQTPAGFAIDAARAVQVAETSPTAKRIHRAEHPLHFVVYAWLADHYEVFFAYHGKLVASVIVDRNGRLGPTYTGSLILGVYARGHYGGLFDSPWVLVPFTLMFLLPLCTRRPRLAQLDIAAVLGFGLSYWLFDTQHLESGVWLAYVPLLYLLGRMLRRGFRSAPVGASVRSRLPVAVLATGLLALVAARIFLTLEPARVIDVATASAIGAYKILHGQSIYYPSVMAHGDTYGPIAYLAYVPFEAIWPGNWTALPAARAAAITFDLATIAGLIALGVRFRRGREGLRLGLLLAWLWAACPFTVLGMIKSTNDGLVAMLLVLTMLTLAHPVRRGVLLALAAAAKFSPAILVPMMLGGYGGDRRQATRVLAAFAIVAGASVAIFLPPGGLQEMYDHTIGFQMQRADIFSPWALHPGLAPLQTAVEIAVLLLALGLALRPRGPRSLSQNAALAAALMIAVQLPAKHWFYLYIDWFLPLVLIAVLCTEAAEALPLREAVVPETKTSDEPRVLIAVA